MTHRLSSIGKKILTVVTATGVTAGGVLAMVWSIGGDAAEQCIRDIARQESERVLQLSAPRLDTLENRVECLSYDIKLIRYIIEEMADFPARKRAMDKMAEPWRVR